MGRTINAMDEDNREKIIRRNRKEEFFFEDRDFSIGFHEFADTSGMTRRARRKALKKRLRG